MKLLLILIFFLKTTFLFSQERIEDLPYLIERFTYLNKSPLQANCQQTIEYNSKQQLVCTKEMSEYLEKKLQEESSRLVYKAESIEEIPDEVKKHIPLPELEHVSKKNPLYISLWHDNDNVLMDTIKSGNDTAYTSGLKLEISTTNKNGISYGGYLYTGLYTQRVLRYIDENDKTTSYKEFKGWDKLEKPQGKKLDEERGSHNQRFIEDSILSAFANNKKQGKWLFWHSEIGVSKLEKEKASKLLGSGIQKSWHELLGFVNYNYIPTAEDTKYGLYLKGLVGAQKEIFSNSICSLNVSSAVGGSFDSKNDKNFFIAEVDVDLGVFKNKKHNEHFINLTGKTNMALGKKALISKSAKLSMNFNRFTLFNELIVPINKQGFSNELNVPVNFMDGDPIHRIGIIVPIR